METFEDLQEHVREFFENLSPVGMLDHGYLKLVETSGSDRAIVEAARMSTSKGFLGWDPGPCEACNGTGQDRLISGGELTYENCLFCDGKGKIRGDRKLLKFLYTKKHMTPFEMPGAIFEIQAPLIVFREWMRHRTQSYNEMSARYIPMPDVNYIPAIARIMMSSKVNKQAGTIEGADVITVAAARAFQDQLAMNYETDERLYQDALKRGVPKELARLHIPVGRYSRMRASANLRNWLAFMTLRSAPDAQWEIRQYSHEVGRFLEKAFPRTMELFNEG